VLFARPDDYVTGGCGYNYNSAPSDTSLCVTQSPSYAWLHGNVQPDISKTRLGLVGPGVQINDGDNSTWSDHIDIRPMMLALTGLQDDYSHEERVLLEDLTSEAVPVLQAHRNAYIGLAQVYKQIDAPVGALALALLHIFTAAQESGSGADDSRYASLEGPLATRCTLPASMW
jgi:hypothetical protein